MGGYFLEYNNFIPADPLKTPPHIAPVWYFTPFYLMLRDQRPDDQRARGDRRAGHRATLLVHLASARPIGIGRALIAVGLFRRPSTPSSGASS